MKYKTAAILAGGKSSRFGNDKALAPFGEKSLLEHIYSNLLPLFNEVLIISADKAKYGDTGARVLPDQLTGAGPLGGIHAALKASGKGYVFITACDMPFISNELIIRMQAVIKKAAPPAVVAGHKGFIEPFHAFYSTELIREIEDSLADSSCGLFTFLKKISPVIINIEDDQIFFNINSPEDLQKITFPIR